ncbi:hypothetical protein RFI_06468 [Reticulomyxa filosa]|uniref:Uncharacterized protein n=1 Tax=Reticulomyxa filosa TaxID=46433 RepID=X6NXP3_RETFI|nr:hypothetical protein RFI_06468 [Reticulomyxa filosa]|eukprot:ETO30653.1 hypothetical protein RFI_06468 [Reticulomyxa filosa]
MAKERTVSSNGSVEQFENDVSEMKTSMDPSEMLCYIRSELAQWREGTLKFEENLVKQVESALREREEHLERQRKKREKKKKEVEEKLEKEKEKEKEKKTENGKMGPVLRWRMPSNFSKHKQTNKQMEINKWMEIVENYGANGEQRLEKF